MQKLVAFAALAAGCSKKQDPGYGVVDPMPPPAVCPGSSTEVVAKARFVGGDVLLELDFSRSSAKASEGDLAPYAVEVIAKEVSPDRVRVRLAVKPGPGYGSLVVPVACPRAGAIEARFEWTKAPPASDAGARAAGLPPPDAGPPDASAEAYPITVRLYER
jgi:hypothetical protein